ncbi:MAG TPA: dienelactone hydrolase family protein [Nitrososphaeraceae archaeon]|nr:dienelactone hydrolase family protein [Nitrososphaeraceae archaeon]
MSAITLSTMILNILPFYIPLAETAVAQYEHKRTVLSLAVTTISSVTNNFINGTKTAAGQAIQNETVSYYENASGYLVYPVSNSPNDPTVSTKKLPAVIMIHENRGLNDNIKDTADILAKQGYVVLAVDLFQGQVTADPNQARELSSSVRNNPGIAIENMKSAIAYLSSLQNVNASRIASIGWCFGGGQSLQLALNSEDHPLAATIIYYGQVVNDTNEISKIKWPVLGIFGDQDQSISVDSVKAFEQALNETGVTNEIYLYPGVGHAFANPSNDNYAPQETADAWKKTLAFLKKYV